MQGHRCATHRSCSINGREALEYIRILDDAISDLSLLLSQGVTEVTLASSAVGASGLPTAGLPASLTKVLDVNIVSACIRLCVAQIWAHELCTALEVSKTHAPIRCQTAVTFSIPCEASEDLCRIYRSA